MNKALKGINLGGWLVLERWMTPSVFVGTEAKDERALGEAVGEIEMRRRLESHRNSFITCDDIRWIASAGFDVVRLPVGYWMFEDQDGFYAHYQYVDRLMDWADKTGLKVLLDLHALPGSQNGWDHSGQSGQMVWHKDNENIVQSLAVLRLIGARYGSCPALYGIEVINEPHWDVPLDTLLGYYVEATKAVRETCQPGVQVIVHDSFRAKDVSRGLSNIGLIDVVMDCHMYQLFSEEDRNLSLEQHLEKTRNWRNELADYMQYVAVMVGEWSAALDEKTYRAMSFSDKHIFESKYFVSQKTVFNQNSVLWCYWSYKTEGGGVWSYRSNPAFRLT